MGLEPALNEMLTGKEVEKFRSLFDVLDKFSRSAPSIKAAVQYAILDAFSASAGVPVYQILGGAKDFIETDFTISIDTLENTVADAKKAAENGFTVLKLKVGEDLSGDIARVLAVQEALPKMHFVVDANMGYTPKQAAEFAEVTYRNGSNIDLFEQPVWCDNFDGLRFVRQHSGFPICADESAKTRYDVLRLVREECVDYINIKLMKSGISDALAIVEIARSANIGLMIGCMSESGLGIAQSVHFAAGTGAFTHHDLDCPFLLKDVQPYKYRLDGHRFYPAAE
jgi:L-alanine-DL-glutamate epimerase-like enolase superfamily enzyme